MKRCCEIREVLVKTSFIGATQLFAMIGIGLARDDSPPPRGRGRPERAKAIDRYWRVIVPVIFGLATVGIFFQAR